MAELTQQERLQPSLLDRLTDNDPGKNVESRSDRVMSYQQIRACVFRDLAWLLNTANYEAGSTLENNPAVRDSVLNYGIPDITGATASGIDSSVMEKTLRKAIIDFEPRILEKTLVVRLVRDHELMNQNALRLDIRGQLWAQPVPQEFFVLTDLDLESGTASISEGDASS